MSTQYQIQQKYFESFACDLSEKRALVTGCASGIGKSISEYLVMCGAEVICCDLNPISLNIPDERKSLVSTQKVDLTNTQELIAFAQDLRDIDILINNAGLQFVSPIEDFPIDMWDTIMAVMLRAPFILIKHTIRGMYEKQWGRIINIASVHGLVASPFKSAYVSAKHGLIGLTKTVALEAAQRCGNLTVNAICPSYVRTPLVENQIASQAKLHSLPENEVISKVLLEANAIKKLIEPEQVAVVVGFLCQESSWPITGSTINLDAGWLAH